ncbi:fatty acid--CoA ligase family protein [Amycolatopsis sp. OK19-0408]|uniref:Fatty acid--CoA ligase family protein n=1 Tax=Amycolatopsis iheyensis TaxID=2945988 RepID=A0A9X2NP29_9PSEU|nr:fatty acid--CoA ligase family protein [Amycolatopsis iheyensis]MCR6488760.1 fatty acid--CoA ligase family protein [Amycolatopsis iheyensis]
MTTTHEHYVQQLLTRFDADPERTAVISGEVLHSAGELAAATRRAAAAMDRQGVTRGDVVGILTEPNTAATLILQWAANFVGATAAHMRWIHPGEPDDELRAELHRALSSVAGVRLLAVDQANEARARDLVADVADRPVVAVLGAGQPGSVDLTAGAEDVAPCPDIADGDLAVVTQIRLMSGRNGVCWTFGVKNDMATAAPWPPPATGRSTFLITAPLIHSDGFGADDTLVSGGVVVLHPGFDAAAVLRAIARHRITRLFLGMPQLLALAAHPDRAGTDTSSLTELFYTGTAAVPERLREVQEAFGPALIQVYGTGEAGVVTLRASGEPDTDGDVGRPVHPDALSIRHPETGVALPDGEVGEVCAIPRWPSAGYWHEAKLPTPLVRDGWLHTGDLGHLDAGGRLHLIGRLSELMHINGVPIHPEVVEKVLSRAPGVAQAAVCGVEDTDRVAHIYAAVVPEPDTVVDVAQLRRRVAEALSDHHVPGLIEIRRSLPKTGWGKPDRVQLQVAARAALTRPVSRV